MHHAATFEMLMFELCASSENRGTHREAVQKLSFKNLNSHREGRMGSWEPRGVCPVWNCLWLKGQVQRSHTLQCMCYDISIRLVGFSAEGAKQCSQNRLQVSPIVMSLPERKIVSFSKQRFLNDSSEIALNVWSYVGLM